MKKMYYKSGSGLLAIVLLMTVALPNLVIAADGGAVHGAKEAEAETANAAIVVIDAENAQTKIAKEKSREIVKKSGHATKKNSPEVKGEGTPEDPKVSTTTTVDEDEVSKETTTTVTKEKEWHGEKVDGNEHSQSIETKDENGNLISASGEAQGKETTTVKDEQETEVKTEEEIPIENGEGKTSDGKTVKTETPDVTVELKPGDEAKQTEDMDAFFDEDSLDIPDWIRQKDGDTSTWITEGSSREEDGRVTNITVTQAENSTIYTRKITSPDGKVTEEKITYTRDAKGRITGYATETKETVSETTTQTTPPANAEIHADGGRKELVYELPDKPQVEEPERDEDGKVVNGKIVVDIHDEEGRVVGYTEVEIRDGEIVGYSDPVLGKLVSKETKVETLENGLKKYTVTKTTLTRTFGNKSSGLLSGGKRMLAAVMGQIQGNVVFNYDSLRTFLPDFTIAGADGEGINNEQHIGKVNSSFLKDYDENGKYFQWLGETGLFSLIYIRDGDGDIVSAEQFEIIGKDGKKYYAYCADLGVYAQDGANYNMQRLEDTDYIQHKDKIRSIVLKGYWGVKNESQDADKPSAGSLDAFKKMLLDNHALTEEESGQLTHGMALLATQAAIWRYGNSGQTMLGEELRFPWGPGEQQEGIINKVYKYLVGMEGTPATASNTILKKDDFAKMIALTVKEKLDDGKYNTDVKIAMAVEFDDETSDLKLYITADGERVDEFRLAGALQEGEKKATKNADGTYTLSGLRLKGNTKFNINLKGVQNLKDGVYIFSCNEGPNGHPAQTLIGAGESKQDIDLNVDLKFNVEEKVNYSSVKSETEVQKLEWQGAYYTYEETEDYDDVKPGETPEEKPDITEEGHDHVEETEKVEKTEEVEKNKKDEKTNKAERIEKGKKKFKKTKGKNRNHDVPKTGDRLYLIQVILFTGALISFFMAAFFATKKNRA